MTDPRRNLALAAEELWQPPAHTALKTPVQRLLAWLRRFFDPQSASIWRDLGRLAPAFKGVVVDVGCGAQPFRTLIPVEARYVGLDTDKAKARFGYAMPETTYYSGDQWPLAEGGADVVLCTEVLEHVLDPRQFLGEARRCLRAGGMLVLTVPFAARWHYVPYDYWRFTPSSLEHLLKEAGFGEVAVYARGNPVTVAAYKSMALVLPFLFPQTRSAVSRVVRRLIGLAGLPWLGVAAAVASLSFAFDYGEDCLGYTIVAKR